MDISAKKIMFFIFQESHKRVLMIIITDKRSFSRDDWIIDSKMLQITEKWPKSLLKPNDLKFKW